MRFCAALFATALATTPAAAQEFFAGRTITILVGFGAGQSADMATGGDGVEGAGQRLTAEPTFDQAARFYAAHLGRFLPGKPSVEFKLVPGAASLVAARQVARGGREGTLLGLLGPAAAFAPIAGTGGDFDPSSLAWIGARQRDDDVCFARSGANVRTIEDLSQREAFVAALTPGSKSFIYPRALNALAATKFRIIAGYASAFEVSRALETGETDAWCGWSVNALRLRHPDLLREGKIRLLVQFSRAAAGARMQIPLASDLPAQPVAREAMLGLERQTLFGGFALAAPARADPQIVAALRSGFLAMLRDVDVLADAARFGLEIDPVPGAELQAEAEAALAISPAARALLRAVLRGS